MYITFFVSWGGGGGFGSFTHGVSHSFPFESVWKTKPSHPPALIGFQVHVICGMRETYCQEKLWESSGLGRSQKSPSGNKKASHGHGAAHRKTSRLEDERQTNVISPQFAL